MQLKTFTGKTYWKSKIYQIVLGKTTLWARQLAYSIPHRGDQTTGDMTFNLKLNGKTQALNGNLIFLADRIH